MPCRRVDCRASFQRRKINNVRRSRSSTRATEQAQARRARAGRCLWSGFALAPAHARPHRARTPDSADHRLYRGSLGLSGHQSRVRFHSDDGAHAAGRSAAAFGLQRIFERRLLGAAVRALLWLCHAADRPGAAHVILCARAFFPAHTPESWPHFSSLVRCWRSAFLP